MRLYAWERYRGQADRRSEHPDDPNKVASVWQRADGRWNSAVWLPMIHRNYDTEQEAMAAADALLLEAGVELDEPSVIAPLSCVTADGVVRLPEFVIDALGVRGGGGVVFVSDGDRVVMMSNEQALALMGAT